MALLTEELRAWIGREQTYTAPEEIGRAALRYFALAIGDDDPDANPQTLVFETNQYLHRRPDEHGYMGHTWDLPVDGCRMLRGGNEYTFGRPLHPSDILTVRWRLEDMTERTGLLFVRSEATCTNQDGDFLGTNLETIIYQPI